MSNKSILISPKFKNNTLTHSAGKGYKKGFTLIELLVVIAIIGILSSIVLASLNSARARGQEANIKSNLKNIQTQAELSYDTPGNYSLVCIDTKIANMITSIENAGGTAKCYSYDNTRWGVSVKSNSDNTKNWSVDSSSVVTWDTADKPVSDWATANTNCAATGGRLPSIEELKALSLSYSSATPPSFVANFYWSGTTHSTSPAYAYYLNMNIGNVSYNIKTNSLYVRCVH